MIPLVSTGLYVESNVTNGMDVIEILNLNSEIIAPKLRADNKEDFAFRRSAFEIQYSTYSIDLPYYSTDTNSPLRCSPT
jgi:hypothetical protein